MEHMNSVASAQDLSRAMASDTPLLVSFTASWCGDCHYLKPSLPELETQFSGKVTFLQVDIDELPAVAQEQEVTGIPSFILFHAGREVYRLVNERRKTKEEVRQFLEKGLSLIH